MTAPEGVASLGLMYKSEHLLPVSISMRSLKDQAPVLHTGLCRFESYRIDHFVPIAQWIEQAASTRSMWVRFLLGTPLLGRLAERSIALVLKARGFRLRGFESHTFFHFLAE